ncbi:MAG: sigma-70 family RNA polymerase sigma factor [Oscillospiraceae bacterium]|nr:sigma-70 family RNA polymerase sigma factor [Oscillospiraceae bacterium]
MVVSDEVALISQYMPIVKIIANKIKQKSSDTVDTDDLVSEGILGLLSAIRTYNEEKGSFQAYANACITNKIRTAAFGRKNSRLSSNEEFDVTQTPDKLLTEEFIIEKESESEIAVWLSETLSETELRVFTLYLNSYSYTAIAEKLSISVKSVDNALSRARGKLRSKLSSMLSMS